MRVLELSLRNYRVFEQVDLELPARVIGVFGPNGAGKSTICESMLFALYGEARTPKAEIRTQGVLTDCEVRLVFEHGGAQYEVRRVIRGKSHVTDAELIVGDATLAVGVSEVNAEVRRLLRMDQQVFRASVFAEQKQLDAFSSLRKAERKEMVLRLLGIKPVDEARGQARSEARETKTQADQWARDLPDLAELKTRAVEAARLAGQADRAAAEAAEQLAEATLRATRAEREFGAVEAVREQVERLEVRLEEARRAAERLAADRQQWQERVEGLRAIVAALPALEEELAALEGTGERLQAARQVVELAAEIRSAERALGALPEVDGAAALAALEAAEAGRRAAAKAAARAESVRDRSADDLARAEDTLARAGDLDSSEPCPTCGQPLEAGFASYVAHCRAEVVRLKKEHAAAAKAAKVAATGLAKEDRAHVAAARAAQAARASLDERTSAEREAAKLRGRLDELARPFDGEVPDVEELQVRATREKELAGEVTRLGADRARLADAEGLLARAGAELAECSTRIVALEEDQAGLAFDREEHARLAKEATEARTLREEAGRAEREGSDAAKDARGELRRLEGEVAQVRTMTERVGTLRDEARYLDRVSVLLDGFRDHLVSRIGPELSRETEALFRDLTNHEYEDVRIGEEDLSIRISDGGQEFDVRRFSGSEVDLANLALRVAISTHLSRVSGADVGVLVLDEVLASLDAERKDLMIRALGRLGDRFHQLFVITHAEQVKDQFPASIEVRKVARRRSVAALV